MSANTELPENAILPEPIKVPMSRYILKNVALPLIIFYILMCGVYILMGLYANFQNKITEVNGITKVLAHNASLDRSELVSKQISESMSRDSTIMNIVFHTVGSDVGVVEDTDESWKRALWNKRLNIHEAVIVDTSDEQVVSGLVTEPADTAEKKPNTDVDNIRAEGVGAVQSGTQSLNAAYQPKYLESGSALIGYITVSVDLQHLRHQWLARHALLILVLIGLFFAVLLYIYYRLRLPLMQLSDMRDQAKSVMQCEEMDLNLIIYNEKDYDELDAICHFINALDQRYQSLKDDYDALKQQGLQPRNQNTLTNASTESSVIHELKNSLSKVSIGLESLESQEIDKKQRAAVNVIRKGSNDFEFVLNQIIRLNRIDKGVVGVNLTEINPTQIINSLVSEFQPQASKYNLSFEAHIHHVDYMLAGDYKKIYSVLKELVSNAISYTTSGGITIDSRVDCFADFMRWTIMVTDTGYGIDEKHFRDVFSPFFQVNRHQGRNQQSSGIGLGVAQKLVQLLKGDLTVDSKVGEGSTFSLILNLREWRHSALYTMLEGINIIAYVNKGSGMDIKKLTSYGASVKTYSDIYTLTQKVESRPFDVLLIEPQVTVEFVRYLCATIRQQETSHRVIIAWYATEVPPHILADLEAQGLDYTINPLQVYKEQVKLIRSWV